MASRFSILLLCAVASASWIGCGGSKKKTSGGAGTTTGDASITDAAMQAADAALPDAGNVVPSATVLALTDYCDKRAAVECKGRLFCDHIDNGVPMSECVQSAAADCRRMVPELARVIDSGLVVYEPAKATQCFAAPIDPFCFTNNLDSVDPSCTQIFRATAGLGDACYGASDYFGELPRCAPGLACNARNGNEGPCPGVCVARLERGQPCKDNPLGCADGLYCREDSCEPFVQKGEPCAGLDQCVAGLRCVPDGGGGLACLEPKPAGAECLFDLACTSLSCRGGRCTGQGNVGDPCSGRNFDCLPELVCLGPAEDLSAWKCAQPKPQGAPCIGDYPSCANGLTCIAQPDGSGAIPMGTCEPRPKPGEGEPCYLGQCAAGLSCGPGEDDSFVCRKLATEGQACEVLDGPSPCATGLVCNKLTRRCAPLLKTGAKCGGQHELCEGLQYCAKDGTCQKRKPWGAPCDVAEECASVRCDNQVCRGYCFAP